jgi:Lipase maturation factor
MFQSGVVKLQAMCPTWWNLTALEFHFSTQCLPGPMAWHAHQIYPFLLRLGVACTLWLEIPATVFILSPFRTIRKVGAILQILLQVLIILTGNYNFFNLLTMALCLPLLDDDVIPVRKPSRILQHLCLIFCGLYSIITWMYMFSFSTVNNALSIKLTITPNDVDRFTSTLVPLALLCAISFITFQALHHHTTPFRVLHGLVCLIFLGIISLPMYDLTPTLKLQKSAGSQWNGVKQVIFPSYQNVARPYLLANGYGLFRRMTGVGVSPEGEGWAGQLPSVVERPEVIIEVETEVGKWHEVQFRWKPGNITVLPKQVAPHAPRLDWQLWFAALGRFNHNQWFLNLIQKILDGCEPVLELIGDPTLKSQKIRRIKSKLYHYDFTRVETDWSKSIPGVKILPGTFWSRIMTMRPKVVWNRKLAREYMGTIDAGNPELSQYLQSQGYGRHCEKSENRCDERGGPLCSIMKFIRINHLNTFIPMTLLIFLLLNIIRYKRKDIAKSTTYMQKDKKTSRNQFVANFNHSLS